MPDLRVEFKQQLANVFGGGMPYDPHFSYFSSPPARHCPVAPLPFHDIWACSREDLYTAPHIYLNPDTWPEDSRLLPSFLLEE